MHVLIRAPQPFAALLSIPRPSLRGRRCPALHSSLPPCCLWRRLPLLLVSIAYHNDLGWAHHLRFSSRAHALVFDTDNLAGWFFLAVQFHN